MTPDDYQLLSNKAKVASNIAAETLDSFQATNIVCDAVCCRNSLR